MRLSYALPFALLAAACGTDTTEGLRGAPPPPVETFTSAVIVHDPVVAIAPNGIMFRAAISDEEQWPVFLLDGDRTLKFPVPEGELPQDDMLSHLSLVASRDGQLHAAWSGYRGLYYARFDYLNSEWLPEGTAIMLAEGSNMRPMMAVADNGMVTIAFADGYYSRAPTFRMMVTKGIISRGFSEPELVNPNCCHGENWTDIDGAWGVSVAGLALDAEGNAHLAYSWDGVVDYVSNQNGAWEHLARWTGNRFDTMDVSLALHGGKTQIAFASEDGQSISYVPDASAAEVQTIPVEGGVMQMRMDLGKDGLAHFAVETKAYDLLYVTDRMQAPIPLVAESDPAQVTRLSKGNGGSLIGPDYGEHVVVFRRSPDVYSSGTVEVAVRPQLP